MLPPDAFGRPSRLPDDLAEDQRREAAAAARARSSDAADAADLRDRVAMIGSAAACMLRGDVVPMREGLFLAGAIEAWLLGDGDLVRDYLKVAPRRGSHRTAQWAAKQLRLFE